jgi:predicted flap endonuclease-1-like 5' DNA nuclease
LKALISEQNSAQEQTEADKASYAARIEDASHLRLELENTCTAAQSEVAEMTDILEEQDRETKELQSKLTVLTEAQSESDELRTRLQELEDASANITSQHENVSSLLVTEQAESQKLRRQLEHLTATIQGARKAEVAHDEVGPETKTLESIEKEPVSDDTDSLPILETDDFQDDLKTIRGVGAKIEQKLNMLGIRNFKSLVDLDNDGYERAAKLIPSLEGRMRRDGWSDQARELHLEKYNEAI